MTTPAFSSMVSFATGATCLAADWNTNNAYVVSALTGGLRDLSINSVSASNVSCSSISPLTISGDHTYAATLTVDGELKGDRVVYQWGTVVSAVSGLNNLLLVMPAYGTHSVGASMPIGFYMNRPGSIVGFSYFGMPIAFSVSGTVSPRMIKRSSAAVVSTVFSASNVTYTALNQSLSVAATFARGVHTFTVGDRLVPFLHAGLESIRCDLVTEGYFEVIFDT